VDEIRAVDQVNERRFDAVPFHNTVPQGEARMHTLHPDIEDPIEDLVGSRFGPCRSFIIQPDLGHTNLLEIFLALQLVDVVVSDDVIGRIEHGTILDRAYAQVRAVDLLRDFNPRIDDHVDPHVVPGVECPAQVRLEPLTERVLGPQGELVVDVHLVPGDLINQHHGAFGSQAVERLPEVDRLLLDGKRCDLGDALPQLSQNGYVACRSTHSTSWAIWADGHLRCLRS